MRKVISMTLIVAGFATVAGCSDSEEFLAQSLPVIEQVDFAYIKNGALKEFDPESGESRTITSISGSPITSPEKLILTLDIDSAQESSDEEVKGLIHSLTPEFAVYSQVHDLYLFDYHTRRSHHLHTFLSNETGDKETICDIKRSIILDEETRLLEEILYKEEMTIYVKTAPTNCTQPNYSYYQISIENTDEEYTIRRNFLLDHVHVSKHEHDHDDGHDHVHTYEAGEIGSDGLPFNPNNHYHPHQHQHDFRYQALVEHDFLSKAEIDAVHNNPQYQEIRFETHPIKKGIKRPINESLMYAKYPIFDSSNKSFGYLGYDATNNQYNFYNYDLDNRRKSILWQLELSSIGIPAISQEQANTQLSETGFTYIDNAIIFLHGSNLIKLPILALFDDDQETEREQRFENPLHSFTSTDDIDYRYRSGSDQLFIQDGLNIHQISNVSSTENKQLITSYNPASTQAIDLYATDNRIVLQKFPDATDTSATSPSSFVYFSIQEQTLSTFGDSYRVIIDDIPEHFAFYSHSESDELSTEFFDNSVNRESVIDNMLPTRLYNQTNTEGYIINLSLGGAFSSQSIMIDFNGRSVPLLDQPNIYAFDPLRQASEQWYLLGTLPSAINEILSIEMKSNYYGEVKVKQSYAEDAAVYTYFFPFGQSFINPTGQFGDMKLMYDDQTETESP